MNFKLARAIVDALPRVRRRSFLPADQLALSLLLEGTRGMTVKEIVEALGLPQASTSELIARAVKDGRVERARPEGGDRRQVVIYLTTKGLRERHRARSRTPPR